MDKGDNLDKGRTRIAPPPKFLVINSKCDINFFNKSGIL